MHINYVKLGEKRVKKMVWLEQASETIAKTANGTLLFIQQEPLPQAPVLRHTGGTAPVTCYRKTHVLVCLLSRHAQIKRAPW